MHEQIGDKLRSVARHVEYITPGAERAVGHRDGHAGCRAARRARLSFVEIISKCRASVTALCIAVTVPAADNPGESIGTGRTYKLSYREFPGKSAN
ncbi:MAG: hypothetical protein GF401_05320 [Chitinivibrionales bacterium]|nr:hypothetical protein [Chitinivibrionales bacterium]